MRSFFSWAVGPEERFNASREGKRPCYAVVVVVSGVNGGSGDGVE
jgi:hypothetical protein